MQHSLQTALQQRLDAVAAVNRYRRRRVISGAHAAHAIVDGQACVNFCSNDYLGLAAHPDLIHAMQAAASRVGVGTGASQLITGRNAEHQALEEELADYVGRERALLFATGYSANVGTVAALMGKADSIVADALNHASLIDGARLSGAAKRVYRHADKAAAAAQLQACSTQRKLLLTDAVFSMDGDVAPLTGLAALARAHDAWLMVDDAHGLGVRGPHGAGSVRAAGLDSEQVPILIATLGKSLGAAGAFVAGDEALIEYLVQSARALIFSTAPPPAVAAAARAGLRLARAQDWRREHLHTLIKRFRRGAEQLGLSLAASTTPIQPLILGDEQRALVVSDALFEKGYLVAAIRPPTVAPGTCRLRITLTAAHTQAQVDGLLEALEHVLADQRVCAVS